MVVATTLATVGMSMTPSDTKQPPEALRPSPRATTPVLVEKEQ